MEKFYELQIISQNEKGSVVTIRSMYANEMPEDYALYIPGFSICYYYFANKKELYEYLDGHIKTGNTDIDVVEIEKWKGKWNARFNGYCSKGSGSSK